ncbi:MAG: hypothetical protein BSOLF_1680 [Candidatus Carbobacillus altaicus]|uniref:Uncharacterized protein n=1 Tax=Candidatus Carbonibacillus altaicus TaxID=2163959 RepID=A0A2R6Y3V4_9BACL|nr:MAG: hypothetical protein BSOLF_1680 [Candidatus Carbobacillus altaicus]
MEALQLRTNERVDGAQTAVGNGTHRPRDETEAEGASR